MTSLLNFAIENGIINEDALYQEIDNMKRKCYLSKHPYNIWFGKDDFWHTYLPIDGKRKAIKKKYQKDIEDVVIDFWKSSNEECFKARFEVWITRQQACGRSNNTIYKYKSDYKRFFAGYPIENINVKDITDVVLGNHIMFVLKEKEFTYRALKDIFGYVKGVFDKCIKDKLIAPNENPCVYIDLPIYRQYCIESDLKTVAERTLSSKEIRSLKEKVSNINNSKPNYIPQYAVELAVYTGMRVGELSALCWGDIDYESMTITISKSEKRDKITKEYSVAQTKNYLIRTFPITEEIADILKRVKWIEMKNGWLGEYVFMNDKGRIHANAISNYAARLTSTEEFHNTKSIHAIRRTLNSNLRCMGVSVTVAASLLGHTEEVNTNNYTYDVTSLETKKNYVKQAASITF